jgi:hypothetical protein
VTDQLQIFQPGCTLADTTLEQRLAAVIDLIAAGEVPVSEREELLMLALAPAAWGAER